MKNIPGMMFLLVCLSLAGCGQDQYFIERKYFHTQKQALAIIQNPDMTPDAEFARVAASLEDFYEKYPQSNISASAQFVIVRLYMARKEYEKARGKLDQIIARYVNSEGLRAEAVFIKGNSYEIEGKWDEALSQFKILMHDYPTTTRGFATPFYIAGYYQNKYQPDKVLESLRGAVEFYRGLAEKYPVTPVGLESRLMLAQSYAELKEWPQAVTTLENILTEYKGKSRMDNVLMNLATIYARELKDTHKAREMLERVVRDYPGGKTSGMAEEMLKKLGKDSNGHAADHG